MIKSSCLKSLIFILTLMLSLMLSCEKEDISTGNGDDDVADGTSHELESDYSWDNSSEVTITLNGTSITKNSSNVSVNGSTATITAAGNYRISGTLTNGQIMVNASDDAIVRLIFDGVNITNSSSSAVVIKNTSKTIIDLVAGTTNSVTDGSTYSSSDEDLNAAIFSKSDLTIFGEGTLTVKGNYLDGITSKDGLVIKSGTYNVTAKDDGIRGKDYLIVRDGTITVTSGGDGLKSDNDANSDVGYVLIDNGSITVTSTGDGISAQTYVSTSGSGTYSLKTGGGSSGSTSTSAKGIKGISSVIIENGTYVFNSADDAIHSEGTVTIAAGNIQISTSDDGIHAETAITIDDGTIKITKSYEALESKNITIKGGDLYIVASNDAINATAGTVQGGTEQNDGSCFTMNGGTLFANCTNGDAIDSNGNVLITGGTAIANGPEQGIEEAADINGSFNMNGGFFIGSGTNSNMNKTMSSTSTQRNIYVISSRNKISLGSIFHIQDNSGQDIVTFLPVRGYYSILFSSSGLATGVTYSIYTGGSCTGTVTNGLYSGGTYSGGTLKKSFTLSTNSTVTSVSL